MAAKSAKGSSNSAGGGERTKLVKLVDNPISYLVLVLLVVEALFGGMAWKEGDKGPHTSLLIWACILFIAGFVLVVVVLAVWRPEALKGRRRWGEYEPFRIADNVYSVIDGYLRNLPDNDRLEAWQSLSGLFENQPTEDPEFKEFCKRIAETITMKS